MAAVEPAVAPGTAQPLDLDGDAPPAWVHLLPAGQISTMDGRGPYRVDSMDSLISASMPEAGTRLPLCENHATDLGAPQGQPSPARGWIVALPGRPDGLWGQVEWTDEGRQLVGGRAYRHISPVIAHRKDGIVTAVLRASLVNRPNLRGLTSLHAEISPGLLDQIRTTLHLPQDAPDEAILDSVAAGRAAVATAATERQQLLGGLCGILGLAEGTPESSIFDRLRSDATERGAVAETVGLQAASDGSAVLQAVRELRDPNRFAPMEIVVALQAELAQTHAVARKERAERAVDTAIHAGKLAAPQIMREHYITRHMANPEAVELELSAMPSLKTLSGARGTPPTFDRGPAGLDADEARTVALMGVDPEAYAKRRTEIQAREEGGQGHGGFVGGS